MLPTIQKECSQFLELSHGVPLLKNLPSNNDGFRKVKVRKKKNWKSDIVEIFNDTFKNHTDLLQRSIFAHGPSGFNPNIDDNTEPFYIFPINGFKFLYAESVSKTTEDYRDTLSKLIENYGENGIKTFKEVLKYQYSFDNLFSALTTDTEIIIYDIPYYYAIRYSLIESYENFVILE